MAAVAPEPPVASLAVPYSDVRAKLPPAPSGIDGAKSVTMLPTAPSASVAAASGNADDLQISFAQIVNVMMQAPETQNLKLADLNALVLPALRHRQFVVAHGRSKDGKKTRAIGALLWAQVSAEADQRLMTDRNTIPRLRAADWKSGDIAWAILSAGPPAVVNAMAAELSKGPLKGRTIKMRSVGAGGVVTINEVSDRT